MMKLPTNLTQPFFAYGIFKPFEISHFQIKDFVKETEEITITGRLLVRDGLPIFDSRGGESVSGTLIYFNSDKQSEAYQRISEIEPDKHYYWENHDHNGQLINILYGKSPEKGSEFLDEQKLNSWEDPLFNSALDVVKETLRANLKFNKNLQPMFRLQMGYLLLWSSIERYVSLRYHLADGAYKKIMNLAEEHSFENALKNVVNRKDKVYRADKPIENYELDNTDAKKSLEYYYQIRSNITHRGKGINKDHVKVQKSLSELLEIFNQVLESAKKIA